LNIIDLIPVKLIAGIRLWRIFFFTFVQNNSIMRLILGILTLCIVQTVAAQLPAVDIYYGKLTTADGKWALNDLKNITSRPGYDNQPSFSPDGNTIYFTAMHDTLQADIYTYTLLALLKQTNLPIH
jgi:tricorn protease-like protein